MDGSATGGGRYGSTVASRAVRRPDATRGNQPVIQEPIQPTSSARPPARRGTRRDALAAWSGSSSRLLRPPPPGRDRDGGSRPGSGPVAGGRRVGGAGDIGEARRQGTTASTPTRGRSSARASRSRAAARPRPDHDQGDRRRPAVAGDRGRLDPHDHGDATRTSPRAASRSRSPRSRSATRSGSARSATPTGRTRSPRSWSRRPSAGGEVTAVDGTTITVKGKA